MQPLTLVSVVFEVEYPLLLLQASSLERFAPSGLFTEIIVIDNSSRGLTGSYRARLLGAYGDLRSKVRIVRPGDIVSMPGSDGWRTQQVLKLMIALHVSTDWYTVLDAKNHLVRVLTTDFFDDDDDSSGDGGGADAGKPRLSTHDFTTHPLRPNLERVLLYAGLDPEEYVSGFSSTVTPFTFVTAEVRAMIADIARRSGKPFPREFLHRDLTEFFLYAAWLTARDGDLGATYRLDGASSPALWPRAATPPGVRSAVAMSENSPSPFFSVHRRALARLDADAAQVLSTYWTARGLFPSDTEAKQFVLSFQRDFVRGEKAQARRDLPAKLASLPRRLIRLVARRRVAGRRLAR